jgi:hypothetical protein
MKPHIFGIGTGKTGSNSLCIALKRLGFNAYHCGHETYHGNDDIRKQVFSNFKDKCDPLRNIDGIDALMDHPVFKMFKDIDATVPNAKFILTYRNPEECALSWCRMISEQHERNSPWVNTQNRSYKNYIEMVRDHVDSVIEHFFGRPEQLLILDIKDRDETKWKLLCNFLGKDLPEDMRYPRQFDHQKWQTKDTEEK